MPTNENVGLSHSRSNDFQVQGCGKIHGVREACSPSGSPGYQMHFGAVHSPKFTNLLMFCLDAHTTCYDFPAFRFCQYFAAAIAYFMVSRVIRIGHDHFGQVAREGGMAHPSPL